MGEDKLVIDMLIDVLNGEIGVWNSVITVPCGQYQIQTGPDIEHRGEDRYMTYLNITHDKDQEIYGPFCIGKYIGMETAKEEHLKWQRRFVNDPPLAFLDVVTNEVFVVPEY